MKVFHFGILYINSLSLGLYNFFGQVSCIFYFHLFSGCLQGVLFIFFQQFEIVNIKYQECVYVLFYLSYLHFSQLLLLWFNLSLLFFLFFPYEALITHVLDYLMLYYSYICSFFITLQLTYALIFFFLRFDNFIGQLSILILLINSFETIFTAVTFHFHFYHFHLTLLLIFISVEIPHLFLHAVHNFYWII